MPNFETGLCDSHELVAVGKRQWPEQYGVNGGEHRAVGADAERQCRHHGRRKAGCAGQRTGRMTEIAQCGLQPLVDFHVSSPFHLKREIAELEAGGTNGFIVAHPSGL